MFLHGVVLAAGVLTLAWSCGLFIFRNQLSHEKVLPSKRPFWLIVLCWVYLTLMLCAWFEFTKTINSVTLLGTLLVTASAVKMLILLFSYPHIHNVFLLIWRDTRAFAILAASTAMIGLLMVFVATWIA